MIIERVDVFLFRKPGVGQENLVRDKKTWCGTRKPGVGQENLVRDKKREKTKSYKITDYEPEGGLRRDASNPFEPFTDRTATSGAEVYVFVSPKSSLRLVPPEPSSPSIT